MTNKFQVEEREDGRFNLIEIDEYGNKTLRIGGATEQVTEKTFNDLKEKHL